LTYEELSTLLCQIEAVLNSRPLYTTGDYIEDNEILTPGHFLIVIPPLDVVLLKTMRKLVALIGGN